MAAYFPIFIDTNIDTHMIMTVSALDTVSDLKREIEKEHQLCFPDAGKIAVQAVKVKCDEHFYHLPDSLLVKLAFHGVQGKWLLSLDVSVLEEHDGDLHPQNLLTVGGIENNNSVDRAGIYLNGSPRQGIDAGKRAATTQELAIIKDNVSKHNIVVQHNMEIEEASLSHLVEIKKRKSESIIVGNASDMGASKLEISGLSLHSNEKNEILPLDGFPTIPADDVQSSGKRKKKKKKSRNQHNAVAVEPSGTDFREDNIRVMSSINSNNSGGKPNTECVSRQGDQRQRPLEPCIINMEAKHIDSTAEVGRPNTVLSAVDADFTESAAGNIEGRNDISVGVTFGFKKPRNSKYDIVSGVEGNPFLIQEEPNNLQMSTELSRIQNSSTVHVQQVGEERSLAQTKDSEGMQVKTCKSPSKGETEVNNLKVTSEMLDQDGIVAPKSFSKRRRKTKDLVQETLVNSDRENVKHSESEIPQVEPQEASFREHPSNKAKTEEIKLSETSKEAPKTNTENSITHANAENSQREGIDDGNDVFSQQISITEANAENREKRERKKSDKNQKSSKQNCPEFQAEDQTVGHPNVTPTANGKREEASASSLSKSKILEEPASEEQINRPELESEKFGVEIFVPDESYVESGNPTKVQPETVGNTYVRMPAEANLNGNASVICSEAEANNPTGRSTEGNETKDHLLNQCQHENDTSFQLPVDKNNKNRGDGRVSSLQISLTNSNAENREERVRRKSRRKHNSLAENGTDVQAADQNAVLQNRIPATKDHLNGTELQTGTAQSNQESGNCTKVRLEAVGNVEGNLNGNVCVVGSQYKANNPMESSSQGSRISFKKHLTKQHQHEIDASGEVLVEKNNKSRGDHNPKVKERKKKNDSHIGGDSPSLQGKLNSNDEPGIVGKSHGDTIPITCQGSLLKNNPEDSKLQHEKRLPKASRQNRMSNKHLSEHYHKGNGIVSGKNNGKAANILEGRNGSPAAIAPRSIFRDDTSESSEDKGEHPISDAISDAITKTPSDYAVTSDSDEESNTNLTSTQNGIKTPGGKKTGGRSIKKSCSSSAKDLALDTILRSSSRYKKAKLTASQSQQEPEDDSELGDFVPESQGIQ